MDFKVYRSGSTNNTMTLAKDSATVIEAGDLVALSSGLAIKATAASTAVAYCEAGGAAGETEIQVSTDRDLILSGTADAAFAVTQRGTEVDLVVNAGVQQIDVGASLVDVLKILPSTDAGTVGSTSNVLVKINKPII